MCIQTENDSGLMKVDDKVMSHRCPEGEVPMPVITIDAIMTDWGAADKERSLFFSKIDVEGGEYEALLGGTVTFSSKETRPCYVYIELKTNPVYLKAFRLLKRFGYTEVEDLDSGLSGAASYPPKGILWRDEGNYEFRLPPTELKECVARA